MNIELAQWWLTPAAIVFSTIATVSGVGGAIFFSPLFIIAIGLEPKVAIGTALITELFGFSPRLLHYARLKLIDYELGLQIPIFSVPAALVGLYFGNTLSVQILEVIFATYIIFIGYRIISEWKKLAPQKEEILRQQGFTKNYEVHHTDASGEYYYYIVRNLGAKRFLSAIGGLLVGMISIGLEELLDYHLASKCKVPAPIAAGTASFAVVITVLAACIGYFYEFFFHLPSNAQNQGFSVLLFTVPGVLVGKHLAFRLKRIITKNNIKVGLSFLLVLFGLLIYYSLLN